jgi:hypothetical protein
MNDGVGRLKGDLVVLLGVLAFPLTAAILVIGSALGLLAPDETLISITSVAAISVFFLAVLMAHVFNRTA